MFLFCNSKPSFSSHHKEISLLESSSFQVLWLGCCQTKQKCSARLSFHLLQLNYYNLRLLVFFPTGFYMFLQLVQIVSVIAITFDLHFCSDSPPSLALSLVP